MPGRVEPLCLRLLKNGSRMPTRKRRVGTLKLFLGYAPGVGKTFSMLSEAIRRKERGEDIVVGIVESHGRPRTAELSKRWK